MASSDSHFVLDHFCFDFDGTLIDSRENLTTAVNAFRRNLGLSELSQQTVVDALGGEGTWELIMETMTAADFTSINDAIQEFLSLYNEINSDNVKPRPGMDSLLRDLSKNHMAILTNRPADMTQRMVASTDWDGLFDHVYGIDSFDKGKPNPMALENLIDSWGIAPDEMVMVGDSESDIETGRRAGTKTIACTFGYGKKDGLKSENPDWVVDSVKELRELVMNE